MDVVVSDYAALVVTERGGRHRFSYRTHLSGSGCKSEFVFNWQVVVLVCVEYKWQICTCTFKLN